MSDSEFDTLRKQLVGRLASGQIDRAEYEAQLAELQRHYPEAASSAPGGAATADADACSAVRLPSVGDFATVVPAATPIREGYQLDKYLLQQRIGRGGMGEVWKAWDTTGERHVVIKLLPRELQANSDEMHRVRESFRHVHQLQHEHICPTYDLDEHPNAGYYLVMKFIDGGTLSAYRRAYVKQYGNFPLVEAARLLRLVAVALDYAHARKVVHRDIKPQNIMVSRDGRDVQIVDFGLAAQIRTSMSRVSQVQMDTAGTYPYMAPEQWKGEYQDGRTDQYALAIVAYELLAGQLPFDAADPFILRQCALQQALPTVAGQPAHVAEALARATAKTREARFPNCVAFVDALIGKTASPPSAAEAPAGARQPRPPRGGRAEPPVAATPPPVDRTPSHAEPATPPQVPPPRSGSREPPVREPPAPPGSANRPANVVVVMPPGYGMPGPAYLPPRHGNGPGIASLVLGGLAWLILIASMQAGAGTAGVACLALLLAGPGLFCSFFARGALCLWSLLLNLAALGAIVGALIVGASNSSASSRAVPLDPPAARKVA